MKRRLALSLGALVAALSFSSCSSVDHGEVVAEVNGRQLSRDQLASLTEGKTDGATVRSALTQWVRVVSLSDEVGDISTPEELLTEGTLVLAAMIPQVSAAPRAEFEKGLAGGPYLCLAAITLGTEVPAAQVMAELEAGLPFADAAVQYSTNQTLAQSGGVVYDSEGNSCLDSASFDIAFPQIRGVLADAGATVGQPVVVTDASGDLVLLLRAFDDLTLDEQRLITQNELGAALLAEAQRADISISPRMGEWNQEQAQVVPLGDG